MAAILVLFCLLANKPLLPRLRENILLYFEFKNEVASKQNNTKMAAVLNKVYYVMLAVTNYVPVNSKTTHAPPGKPPGI